MHTNCETIRNKKNFLIHFLQKHNIIQNHKLHQAKIFEVA